MIIEENQKVAVTKSMLSHMHLAYSTYNDLYKDRWEFQRWTLVSTGQIHRLPPSRFPTALMAPSRAAPFPAWPDPPVIHFPIPSGFGSWHPSHVGARHRRPPMGTHGPAEPPLGIRTAICDLRKRARKLPSYPDKPYNLSVL